MMKRAPRLGGKPLIVHAVDPKNQSNGQHGYCGKRANGAAAHHEFTRNAEQADCAACLEALAEAESDRLYEQRERESRLRDSENDRRIKGAIEDRHADRAGVARG